MEADLARRAAALALAVSAVGAMSSALPAAAPPAEEEFFRSEELSPDVALCGKQFHVPTVFGPTGMNGWIFHDTLVVREVENGSPADGIVLPNDIITAVNGRPLGGEPLKTFGEQVKAGFAQGSRVGGVCCGGGGADRGEFVWCVVVAVERVGGRSGVGVRGQ